MKNTKLIVKTKSKTYPIYFGNNIVNKAGWLIKKNLPNVKKICIISDNKLPKLLLKKLIKSLKKYELKIYKLSASERTKSFKVANKIIEQLLNDNFNKSDCVIAMGGGVLGDLSAFISNLTKRGLKFINIPTTLLAQADASIGGKTGINSSQGKNLIGTYYHPDFILSDISILKSLPQREIISGYGEILKHSIILDRKFFLWLFKNGKKIINEKNNIFLKKAIIKSCKIKCKVVNKDEKEKMEKQSKQFDLLNKSLFIIDYLPKDKVPNLLSAAAITTSFFIDLPEMEHNSANKFFDGLAAGKPIMINYGGWQAELLKQSGAGFNITKNDPIKAAKKLNEVITNDRMLNQMGLASRKLAKLFDINTNYRKFEKVIDRAYYS